MYEFRCAASLKELKTSDPAKRRKLLGNQKVNEALQDGGVGGVVRLLAKVFGDPTKDKGGV